MSNDAPYHRAFIRAQLSQREGERNPVSPCSSAASSLACIEPCVMITERYLSGFPSSPRASLTSALSMYSGSQPFQPNHWYRAGVGLPAEAPTFHSVVTREALLALVAWQDITEMGIAFCSLTAMEGGCSVVCCSRWIFDLGICMCACLLNLVNRRGRKEKAFASHPGSECQKSLSNGLAENPSQNSL